MTTARLLEMGKDLASRERARRLREDFVRELGQAPHHLIFDFEGVRTLSDSFADELVAVLVEQNGAEWFKEHVRLVNLTAAHRHVVLSAVAARLSRVRASSAAAF